MKKTMALLLICLVAGLADYAFAAQKIMTVYQRAAGDEAESHSITGFNDFAAPVGTGVVKTNATTITLGGGTANTEGVVWYGGDSDAGYCVNGICNFGIGIRAYFEFTFTTVDNSTDSTTYGNGFTFAIINGSNNVKTDRGGSPAGNVWPALMAYAGPGNDTTNYLGLQPPKMAIEFDTYPNTSTNTTCNNAANINANRSDAVNNYNHLALMLWGLNPATACSSGTAVTYDDNRHGAGDGTTSYPYNSAFSGNGSGLGGYYQVAKVAGTPNWLEDNVVHLFRIEIVRESISTDTTGNYIVRAWVDCAGCTAAQLAAFKDTSIPFTQTPAVSPQINRTIVLSAALHTSFNTMLFGFTQATGAAAQAQNIQIKNFVIYFPQCGSDWPPGTGWTWCSYEDPTPPAPGPFSCTFSGTKLVAFGRNCFYNYLNLTSPVDCSNGVFTPDPIVGVYKKCYYK
jgi:hypothetical protein